MTAATGVNNWTCDGDGPHSPEQAQRLELGGGAGVHLCRNCWRREMAHRRRVNRDLDVWERFDLDPWPGPWPNEAEDERVHGRVLAGGPWRLRHHPNPRIARRHRR